MDLATIKNAFLACKNDKERQSFLDDQGKRIMNMSTSESNAEIAAIGERVKMIRQQIMQEKSFAKAK